MFTGIEDRRLCLNCSQEFESGRTVVESRKENKEINNAEWYTQQFGGSCHQKSPRHG